MDLKHIRNFSIIAHIDHGKSTLADRLLELTGTIERRKMRNQVLDAMELERERGITIKMTPVRLLYKLKTRTYQLNLIDTPGHIDFSYEVSRSLRAVEGAILLVDATQGVQAQTLTVLDLAREAKLTIVPVVNKIDSAAARIDATRQELVKLLGCPPESVLAVSAKTGEGMPTLLAALIERLPPPETQPGQEPRALVFDFEYSNHQGVIVYLRVFEGVIRPGDKLKFAASDETFVAAETGIFTPEKTVNHQLTSGEVGYLLTGLKQRRGVKVGDTILGPNSSLAPVAGYQEPQPVIWASLYPASQNGFAALSQALWRLSFSDAALTFEEESAGALGRGFRCGFLGLLHLEITTERLRREFGLELIAAAPTTAYRLAAGGKVAEIAAPHLLPEDLKNQNIFERWAEVTIILPPARLPAVIKLFNEHETRLIATENFAADRVKLVAELPLRELMRRFFADLKNVSAGFASFSYRLLDWRRPAVARLDAVIGGRWQPALSRIVAERRLAAEAEQLVERLKSLLPRQGVEIKIQARAAGRILASRTIPAWRKDVTGYLYGGDISRKKKLWAKQQRGKKKMQAKTEVRVPAAVFLKMLASEE